MIASALACSIGTSPLLPVALCRDEKAILAQHQRQQLPVALARERHNIKYRQSILLKPLPQHNLKILQLNKNGSMGLASINLAAEAARGSAEQITGQQSSAVCPRPIPTDLVVPAVRTLIYHPEPQRQAPIKQHTPLEKRRTQQGTQSDPIANRRSNPRLQAKILLSI